MAESVTAFAIGAKPAHPPAHRGVGAVSSSARVQHTTTLAVENMHCGNCMRKVEQTLSQLPGVAGARVNLSAKRVAIITDTKPITAEAFISALADVGFTATVLADKAEDTVRAADTDFLKRLGVAGFAAANVMLLSVSVWSGHAHDMPASLQTLFH